MEILFVVLGSLESPVLFLQSVAISDSCGHLPICSEQEVRSAVSGVEIETVEQINDSRSGGNVYLKTWKIFCLF